MTIGSKEWFSQKVKELRRDFRALDSITSAIENVTAFIRLWGDGDIIVMSTLHNMAIISYGRMFTKQKKLNVEFKVDRRDFDGTPGFDGDLHKHLMTLRDKIIAHSDASELHCRVGFVHSSFDEVNISFVIASEVRVASLLGTNDIDIIQRYLTHFEACERWLDKKADVLLGELLDAAVDYPANIPGEMTIEKTTIVPLENRKLNSVVPVRDFFSRGPAITPRLIIGADGYEYRQRVKLARRTGKFVLQTGKGPISIDLSTEPPKEEPQVAQPPDPPPL
jgi:hypothetical protein